MKRLIAALGLCLVTGSLALADEPFDDHPSAPAISAAEGIEIATAFLGDEGAPARYCSSVTLEEPGLVPAPHGASRHWVVTFQTAGRQRAEREHVYVDMNGVASDSVPPRKNDD